MIWPVANQIGPSLAEDRALSRIARNQDNLCFRTFCKKLDRFVLELFGLWIVVVGFCRRRTQGHNQIVRADPENIPQTGIRAKERNVDVFLDSRIFQNAILLQAVCIIGNHVGYDRISRDRSLKATLQDVHSRLSL